MNGYIKKIKEINVAKTIAVCMMMKKKKKEIK